MEVALFCDLASDSTRWRTLTTNAWHTLPFTGGLIFVHGFGLTIDEAFHRFVVYAIIVFVTPKTVGAAPATSTTARTFIVSSQGISPSEFATTFGADMWPFARVKFSVALQVMQPTEAGLACLTHVRLFVTVGEEVAFEIVVSRELGSAIWATMLLVGGCPFWIPGFWTRQTHDSIGLEMR
jgi:hypothetical protein